MLLYIAALAQFLFSLMRKVRLISLDRKIYGSGHANRMQILKSLLMQRKVHSEHWSVQHPDDLYTLLTTANDINIVLDVSAPLFLSKWHVASTRLEKPNYHSALVFEGLCNKLTACDLLTININASIYPYCVDKEYVRYEHNKHCVFGPEFHVYGGCGHIRNGNPHRNITTYVDHKQNLLISAGYTDPSCITHRVLESIRKSASLSSITNVFYTSGHSPSYNFDANRYPFAINIGQNFFDYVDHASHVLCSSGLIKYDCLLHRKPLLCVNPDHHHRLANLGFASKTGVSSIMSEDISSSLLTKFLTSNSVHGFPGWSEMTYEGVRTGSVICAKIIELLY